MKKNIHIKHFSSLLFILFFYINHACANLTDNDYFKTVKGEDGLLYSLSLDSKPVAHLFDALPKMRLFQYTGTKATKIGKAFNRVVYPHISSNQDYFMLQYHLPTSTDGEMLVEISDLNLAPNDAKVVWQTTFEKMYNAAQKANTDFIASEGAGLRTSTATKLRHAYISFRINDASQFVALYKNRYLITITLKAVDNIASCSDVENYLQAYIQKIDTTPLDDKSSPQE